MQKAKIRFSNGNNIYEIEKFFFYRNSQYMRCSTEYFKWDIVAICIYAKLTLYYGWQIIWVVLNYSTIQQLEFCEK